MTAEARVSWAAAHAATSLLLPRSPLTRRLLPEELPPQTRESRPILPPSCNVIRPRPVCERVCPHDSHSYLISLSFSESFLSLSLSLQVSVSVSTTLTHERLIWNAPAGPGIPIPPVSVNKPGLAGQGSDHQSSGHLIEQATVQHGRVRVHVPRTVQLLPSPSAHSLCQPLDSSGRLGNSGQHG